MKSELSTTAQEIIGQVASGKAQWTDLTIEQRYAITELKVAGLITTEWTRDGKRTICWIEAR